MQLFVNDLTVMDFSYLCPERGMVGESWIVDVILHGSLNEESMVLDFGKVKKELKYLIDEYVDHKLVIPAEHAYTESKTDPLNDNVVVSFNRPGHEIYLSCPAESFAFVYADEVTMTSVSGYLRDVLAIHLPDNVNNIELILRTEQIPTPFYHYTHGLKKHDGNCQRIAHGHRSKITVMRNGENAAQQEAYWAQRWRDIYIGTSSDVVPFGQLSEVIQATADSNEKVCFAYEASQGKFELVMPENACELIDSDSTVECLAQYIADEQKSMTPDDEIQIFAYEGVGKGAIAYA